ncbi:MAG: hypothetical protein B7Z43_09035 [Sphingomonas sp. 12-62-6]|nr:MAG: hypothetical protein B7Z43_09035 [Sphingomonas sp. 12-62-6]
MTTFVMAIAALLAAPAPAQAILPGTWANPSKSVHVAFKRCGPAMCGTIVWANAKAKADAARGGTNKLIGAVLFEKFVADGAARWRGAVFIPDIGQRVSGTITQENAKTIIGEGCLIAGLGCKSQRWSRIK